MGSFDVGQTHGDEERRRFSRHLIEDLRALEYMLEQGKLVRDVRYVGVEQEMFLVNREWQPSPVATEVIEECDDPQVVPELTRFNVEFNLDPVEFGGSCLRDIENAIDSKLTEVRRAANVRNADIALAGILPTIRLSDVSLDNMMPHPRYRALNDAIAELRGGPIEVQIRGVDELYVKHESIMLEGCNTSFQTHFQVNPDEFARYYNIAQLVAAPVLAAAANSPLLFGKRLWRETRIALFQQAIDTRSTNLYVREMSPRVHFGSGWVQEDVTEIFKEDIARFRIILAGDALEDPFEAMQAGRVPKLQALQLYNSTVYRWNRACYGITHGTPHIRIENRILPAGPTPADEVANAAFWFGLVSGIGQSVDDIREQIDFDAAKSNFIAAARLGLASQLEWLNGRRVPAQELIEQELIPVAREGLAASGIDEADIDRYLGIIEDRVRTRQTGSQWQLESYNRMRGKGSKAERLSALTAAMINRQLQGLPVHEWEIADISEAAVQTSIRHSTIEQFMTTDLFTVNENELVDLVAALMDWQRLRHVLIEDNDHHLVGLVSHRNVLRFLARFGPSREGAGIAVSELMVRDPITVSPETPTLEAVRLMRHHKIGALPVIHDGHLVGLVTAQDFIRLAGELLEIDGEERDVEFRTHQPSNSSPSSPRASSDRSSSSSASTSNSISTASAESDCTSSSSEMDIGAGDNGGVSAST